MNNFILLLSLLVICTGVRATWPLDWGLGGWGFGAWTSHHSPAREAQDEVNDAEILKAVVTSMAAWERSRRDTTRSRRADGAVCYPGVGCFMGSAPFSYLGVLPAPPAEVGTSFHFFSPKEPNRARSLAFEEIVVPAAAVSLQPQPEALQQVRGRRDNAAGEGTLLSVVAGSAPGETSTAVPGGNASSTAAPTPPGAPESLETALSLGFNSSLNTKMIVHGFGSSCSHVWVHEMRSALMAVEDCNVICVDWEPGASIPNYVRAAANTRLVGKQVALLLHRLRSQLGLDPRRVHLIGFSLGAHVAGFAGAETPGLSRITGLDPAGPLFESQESEARLDAGDAQFVDVIHSNGENLILGGLGSWQPMGHVDFYPNGGREQKGCSNLLLGAVSDISLLWSSSEGDSRSLCNHRRAYKFFTDSVSPRCPFPAFPCDSFEDFLDGSCFQCSPQRQCGNMGYYSDRSPARGPLFLITRDNEPFCAHQFYVRLENSPSPEPVVTNGRLQVVLSSKELNETFALTQKDDELLQSGSSLERLVVAHPVMSHPAAAQLVYTSYSGWISSGTATWTVDKVLVTDAFGKSVSFCKRGMVLSTGVPLLVPLFPGDCNPPGATPDLPAPAVIPQGVIDLPDVSTSRPAEVMNETTSSTLETVTERRNQTGLDLVITLGGAKSELQNADDAPQNDQHAANHSTTTPEYPLYQRPWLTEEPNNSIAEARVENSRSFPLSETKRALNVSEQAPQSTWSFWWRNKEDNNETPASNNSLVTVQMLPQRLASILQQAEQYARATISSVATTIIGGNKEESIVETPKRRPKYFPPFSSLFGYDTKQVNVNSNERESSLRLNQPSSRQDTTGFSPIQVIKSQEWRISRYIPLRRYASSTRRVDQNEEIVETNLEKNNSGVVESKPTLIGPR